MTCNEHSLIGAAKGEFDIMVRVKRTSEGRDVTVFADPANLCGSQVPDHQLAATAAAITDYILWRRANDPRTIRTEGWNIQEAQLGGDLDTPVPPLTDKGREAVADVIAAARRDLVAKRLESDRDASFKASLRRQTLAGDPTALAIKRWGETVARYATQKGRDNG